MSDPVSLVMGVDKFQKYWYHLDFEYNSVTHLLITTHAAHKEVELRIRISG